MQCFTLELDFALLQTVSLDDAVSREFSSWVMNHYYPFKIFPRF